MMIRYRSLLVSILLLVLLSFTGVSSAEGVIALTGATLIDGTGAAPRPDTTIIIVDGRIVQIGPTGKVDIPAGAEQLELGGKYVLPGFIDLHGHLSAGNETDTSASLATLRALQLMDRLMQAGITAVRDVGGDIEPMQALLQARQAGYIESLRLYPSGQLITTTGGHSMPGAYFATGPYGFREAVRTMYDAGFKHVKLSPTYTQEEVDAAVDEAKVHGMHVTSHGGGYSDTMPTSMTRRAVLAGVHSIEHLNQMSVDVLDLMQKKNIHIVPTMALYRTLYEIRPRPPVLVELMEKRGWSMAMHEDLFKAALKRSIVMGVGTDANTSSLQALLPGLYFDELKYFVELGMSPMEAIITGTRNGAIILGLEDDLGTIETGKLADLQIIDGNPLDSFDVLGDPLAVMVGGSFLKRSEAMNP